MHKHSYRYNEFVRLLLLRQGRMIGNVKLLLRKLSNSWFMRFLYFDYRHLIDLLAVLIYFSYYNYCELIVKSVIQICIITVLILYMWCFFY